MFTTEIQFNLSAKADTDQATSLLSELLGLWRQSGQIYDGFWPMTRRGRKLLVHVSLPEECSLNSRFANKYVRSAHKRLRGIGLSEPTIRILGPELEATPACSCRRRQSYILFTTYAHLGSSLHCGDCFSPVPLYRIPPTDGESYDDVLCWETDYKSCDSLQMNCSTGEKFGTREISRFDSSLSKRGRKICARIESSTKKPAYYYLYRGSGKSLARERVRTCPQCGGKWLLKKGMHKLFDFKCDKCRLVSNIAWNVR